MAAPILTASGILLRKLPDSASTPMLRCGSKVEPNGVSIACLGAAGSFSFGASRDTPELAGADSSGLGPDGARPAGIGGAGGFGLMIMGLVGLAGVVAGVFAAGGGASTTGSGIKTLVCLLRGLVTTIGVGFGCSGTGFGGGSGARAAGATGVLIFGLTGAATGLGMDAGAASGVRVAGAPATGEDVCGRATRVAGTMLGVGAGGITVTGLGWVAAGALTLTAAAGAAGFAAGAWAGFGGGTTTGAALTAGCAETGFGAAAVGGAGLALAAGGGPNVILGRSGKAAMRGFEIEKSSGAIAGDIFA